MVWCVVMHEVENQPENLKTCDYKIIRRQSFELRSSRYETPFQVEFFESVCLLKRLFRKFKFRKFIDVLHCTHPTTRFQPTTRFRYVIYNIEQILFMFGVYFWYFSVVTVKRGPVRAECQRKSHHRDKLNQKTNVNGAIQVESVTVALSD